MTNARLHSFPSSHKCLHLTLIYLRISKDRRKNLKLTSVRVTPEAEGKKRVAWRTTSGQSKAHQRQQLLSCPFWGQTLMVSSISASCTWKKADPLGLAGAESGLSERRAWVKLQSVFGSASRSAGALSNPILIPLWCWTTTGMAAWQRKLRHQSYLGRFLINYKSYSYPCKCRNHLEIIKHNISFLPRDRSCKALPWGRAEAVCGPADSQMGRSGEAAWCGHREERAVLQHPLSLPAPAELQRQSTELSVNRKRFFSVA